MSNFVEKMVEFNKYLRGISEDQKCSIIKGVSIKNTEGKDISVNNALLLLKQTKERNMENPTVIGGFNQWKKQNRIVKKGQKALNIFAPQKGLDENAKPKMYIVSVFDVSQTEEIKI